MARISSNRMITRRISKLKKRVKFDTQQIRQKTIISLQELFDLSVTLAKGQIKTQTEGDKKVTVTLRQRQMWARIAAYIGQIMSSVASGFDEREIDTQLEELEKLVGEAITKGKDQGTEATASRPSGS